MFSCQNEQRSRKSRINESELKRFGKGNEFVNRRERKRDTHYPVPSKVKVSKLEMTSGFDMTLYSYAPRQHRDKAIKRSTGSMGQIIQILKVSHLRKEMLASAGCRVPVLMSSFLTIKIMCQQTAWWNWLHGAVIGPATGQCVI